MKKISFSFLFPLLAVVLFSVILNREVFTVSPLGPLLNPFKEIKMFAFLPWWGFLVPLFLLGIILPLKKWKVSSFLFGFLTGFLTWSLSTLYFETFYEGEIINEISQLISANNFVIYLFIGLIGGILTGFTLYSGSLLKKGREVLHLELPEY